MKFDPAEARHFLDLPEDFSPDDLRDAEEMAVFPLRDFFLRNNPVRPLWEARLRKIDTIARAVQVLEGETDTPISAVPRLETLNLIDLLSTHQSAMAALKTAMASQCRAMHTIRIAQIMMDLEDKYMSHFLLLTAYLAMDKGASSVLVSGEAGELIAALRSGDNAKAYPLLSTERARINGLLEKIRK